MNKEKDYIGSLNIDKEMVSIDTDFVYQLIEIHYVGTINIISLLPENYIIKKGNNKILIIKLNKGSSSLSELFKYEGYAMITRCNVLNDKLVKNNLYVNKSSLEFWNTLIKVEGQEEPVYEYMTRNWEDLDFDGNNKKYNYIHRKTIYDNETEEYTTTKEIRKR